MTLRATRSFLFVLTDLPAPSVDVQAEDTLLVQQTADSEQVHGASDSLSLSADASCRGVFVRTATDTLVFEEGVSWRAVEVSVSDMLTITEMVTLQVGLTASDTLTISESVSVEKELHRDVPETVPLADVVFHHGNWRRSVGQTLRLRHQATVAGPRNVSATHTLQTVYTTLDPETGEVYDAYIGLSDRAQAAVVGDDEATDRLKVGDRARGKVIRADAIAGVAEDALSIIDAGYRNETPAAVDALTITESAAAVDSRHLRSQLTLSHTAAYTVDRALGVVDTLVFHQAAGARHLADRVKHVYAPVGLPPLTPGAASGVKLIGDTTLVLKAPRFGNRDRLQMNRISRETRGGTLITFADPAWPKVQTLVLQWLGLTESAAMELLDFIEEHLGREIHLEDWEGRTWVGVIMEADPAVEDGKRGYSLGLTFEGELE